MKQILGTFSFLILIVTILIALVSNYIVDVRGITLEGIYECQAKRIENIPLKNYYRPTDIQERARDLGYKTFLHTGFGEPDADGSGIYLEKTIDNQRFKIILTRIRTKAWKNEHITSGVIENSCLVPNNQLKNMVVKIMEELKIETQWVSGASVKYDFTLPWIKFDIL